MFLRGSVDGFLALRKSAGSEFAREHQYLLAGPWVHIPWGDRIGTADFGPEALIDTDTILLRWFDHWLKDSGTFDGEAARPPLRARGKSLARSGNFSRRGGIRPLPAQRGQGKFAQRKWNALHREPRRRRTMRHLCARSRSAGHRARRAGRRERPFDQAALEMGNNLLVYSTEPLEKPLWVFGIPRVVLYCSTSRASADFTAKLVRARPNGAAEFICMGIARSSRLFAETKLCRGQNSPLGFFPRAYLLPFCQGRPHPAGNCQQRISAL